MTARTFYLTRDTDYFGNLSDTVDLWEDRPVRTQLSIEAGWIWLPQWDASMKVDDLGEVRNLPASYVAARWGSDSVPKDDADCIRIMVTDELCE